MKEGTILCFLLFIIRGLDPVSCFPDRRSGHSEAENISEMDACPHLQNPPGEKFMKLRPLVVAQRERFCCGCGEGQRLAEPCNESSYTSTRCEDCPPNTYMDLPIHFNSECFVVPNNLHCSDDELYIPYTATSKPKCRCRDNHYRASNGTCLPHTACGFGKGVKRLGNHNSDTICEVCGEHFESNLTSSIEKCRLKESVHNHPKNVERTEEAFTDIDSSTITSTTQESYHTQATSNQTTSDKKGILDAMLISGSIVIAVLVLISGKDLYILKKKTKTLREKINTKIPRIKENLARNIPNQKENNALQSARLLNETNINIAAQSVTKNSNKHDDDESEPTSSSHYLPPNIHEQDESPHGKKEDNEKKIEKEKQRTVIEYFLDVSTSNGYCFLDVDVNILKDSHGIYIESNTADSFGMQMYKVVKGGFDQNKLTVEELIDYLKAKNLNTIVEELENKL